MKKSLNVFLIKQNREYIQPDKNVVLSGSKRMWPQVN